jgi:phosphoribosyl 1,2-cyclic phosphodiesterase
VKYGGNTTCVFVETVDGVNIIFDAGTGCVPLGDDLLMKTGFGKTPINALWFFTHTHWDHIQGFPFFAPAYFPSNHLLMFGPAQGVGDGVETALFRAVDQQQSYPHFPVALHQLPCRMKFFDLFPQDVVRAPEPTMHRHFRLGDTVPPAEKKGVTIRNIQLNHPQGCYGYKVTEEATGKSFVFMTDHEPFPTPHPAIQNFIRGTDLLLQDAQYTDEEYSGKKPPSRLGWGHSTPSLCLRDCHEPGDPSKPLVKALALTHHEPRHNDAFIDQMGVDTQEYAKNNGYGIPIWFAEEGKPMEV